MALRFPKAQRLREFSWLFTLVSHDNRAVCDSLLTKIHQSSAVHSRTLIFPERLVQASVVHAMLATTTLALVWQSAKAPLS